ncbi:Hypothetical protein PHPALM_9173 [Phytophthora palmivora]|uniref:Uncharacterized protein n=1 Tax=Phytophthora palmivora TaxID=4796 RepID=A0A2P4Y7Y1_9STRA|nr:Hypothetical protein PHPALM_9173 [Phytophthora palmivora]
MANAGEDGFRSEQEVPSAHELGAPNEQDEEIMVNAGEDGFQSEQEVPSAHELGAPNEQDDEGQIPLSIPTKNEEEREIESIESADNKEESNIVVTSEVKVEDDTCAAETALVATVEAPMEKQRDNHEETNSAGVHESTNKINAETEEMIENATTRTTENVLLDTVLVETHIQDAALTLQCMLRCFIARQRMKHKREERQNANQSNVESPTVCYATDTTDIAPSPMIAEGSNENTNTLASLPAQEAEQKEEPYLNDTDLIPQPDIPSDHDSPAMAPFDVEQDSPLISAQNDVRNDDIESADTPPSPRPAVSSVQSSAVTWTQKQHPRQDLATISTRLPSVLDVAKYFPLGRSTRSSAATQSRSFTNSNEHAAITRKKVDIASPRVRRALQQERIEREQLMENRRKENERAQHAQVVEYQRIYAESRKKYEDEKQRLLAEKMVRDNQRDHDAEVEKRARIQSQRERDAARRRYKTVDDKADRLVWEHMKTQGQPTQQSVSRFRDALSQALDSVQFPDKMCEERARELNERIKRLHHASWAVDSQLEDVELLLISELHPLTARQRPFQAKYAIKLRWRLEQMLNMVQSWQRVIDERESGKESGSMNKYWGSIQARYAPSSAISSNAESRRQYVLNEWRGAVGGDSLLHVAAWNGWEEHVRLLIEEGSDVNLVDCSASHRTPLHEACRAGHAPIVEQLLRSGARLNAVDSSGDSSLHVACRGGWTRVVRILLMAANDLGEESDPSAVDNQTPLTQEDFFNLRNGKGKRAIEVTTLPSLVEELQSYMVKSTVR